MKGVAMSAGRHWLKEFYVGFLLLLLSFLYLSHLNRELRQAELRDEVNRIQSSADALASAKVNRAPASLSLTVLRLL